MANFTGDDNPNSLTGSSVNDVMLGNGGGDVLAGAGGNDKLDGGAGDDILIGGPGNDTLIGGIGNDIFIVDSLKDKVTESATIAAGGSSADRVQIVGDFSTLAAIPKFILGNNVEILDLANAIGRIDGLGNAGANTIIGNAADNVLDGGKGNDLLQGGAGNDTYIVDSLAEIDEGGNLDSGDTIKTALQLSALVADIENYINIGGTAWNLTGDGADNKFVGGSAGDHFSGGAGNDWLDGGKGDDILAGGSGDDVYVLDKATDSLTELANDGTADRVMAAFSIDLALFPNVENASLTGSAALNLTGDAGINDLIGNAGKNRIDGKGGADRLAGGKGDDTYIVDDPGDQVSDPLTAKQGGGVDLALAGVDFALGHNLENLTLTGAAIKGAGNALANLILGNGGANKLMGLGGDDKISGFDADDQLSGGSGNDKLDGGAGNDWLDGGRGDDVLTGGLGDDRYVVDSLKDKIVDSATLAQGGGVDEVSAWIDFSLKSLSAIEKLTLLGARNLSATGNALDNVIVGNAGHNTLDGGKGNDLLQGGAGNDTYWVDSPGDQVDEGTNMDSGDTIRIAAGLNLQITGPGAFAGIENFTYAGNAAWVFTADGGANRLSGGGGADTLFGLDGGDTLLGGLGIDILRGGNGDDILDGGKGDDSLYGGAGNDVYIVDSQGDSADEEANLDSLDIVHSSVSLNVGNSFSGIERFELIGSAALSLTGDKNANVLVGNVGDNALSGGDGNDALHGGAGKDDLSGGDDDDQLFGDGGDDILTGGKGNDVIDGGAGIDIVSFSGNSGNYTITRQGVGAYQIVDNNTKGNNNQGSDTLTNVEILRFADRDIAGPTIILDVNPLVNAITEGASADTPVGIVLSATDPAGKGTIGFSLIDDAGGRFKLDPGGILRVADGLALDFEAAKIATIRVRATVAAPGELNEGLYTEQNFTIAILDNAGEKSLAAIDGEALPSARGFRIDGAPGDAGAGGAFAAGDIDGDGFSDLFIGAPDADRAGHTGNGGAYILFGKAGGFANGLDLAALDGRAGFRIDGLQDGDRAGAGFASADINGDGLADLILAAPDAAQAKGAVYVIFGNPGGFAPLLDLAALDGTNGFRFDGLAAGDAVGRSLGVGDINGDGLADLAIGSPGANNGAGSVATIFGRSDWSGLATIDSTFLDGKAGFRFDGIAIGGALGTSLDLKDCNGDGFADLLMGVPGAGGAQQYGAGYGLFGKADWSASPSLDPSALAGGGGFSLSSTQIMARFGQAIAAIGDLNGDGIGDLAIAGDAQGGPAAIIFGQPATNLASLDIGQLDGANGFQIHNSLAPGAAYALSAAGDVNGDGIGDLLVGVADADLGTRDQAGAGYLLFGRTSGFAAAIDLSKLSGADGFRILGSAAQDHMGSALAAAGDLNGDGFDDIVIGAPGADPDGFDGAGAGYVLYGGDFSAIATKIGSAKNDNLKGSSAADRIFGGLGNDILFGKGGADILNGGAGEDSLHAGDLNFRFIDGGSGRDVFEYDAAGQLIMGSLLNRLSDIESLDVDNGLANAVILNLADLMRLQPGGIDFADNPLLDHVFVVEGDLLDSLTLAAGDNWGAADLLAAPGYAFYTINTWKLAVDSDVQIGFI